MPAKPKRKPLKRDVSYWRSRLERERPDLLALVEAGTVTINAAAERAGWRKPRPKAEPPKPWTAHVIRPGHVHPDGRSWPPQFDHVPIVGWLNDGRPIVGTAPRPDRLDIWTPNVLNPDPGAPGRFYGTLPGGRSWIHPVSYFFDHPEGEDHFVIGEIGHRHRRTAGCDFPRTITLDPREALDVFLVYERTWTAAAEARERLIADLRARPGAWHAQWGASSSAGSSSSGSSVPFGLDGALRLLGLAWPCTMEQLKARHHALVKQHHPDGGGDTPMMAQVNAAADKVEAAIRDRAA